MLNDLNPLFGIPQANVNLGVGIANLWLETLDRNQALVTQAIKDSVASTQKATTTIAANRDLMALLPLHAELMHEQAAQFTHFWQKVMADVRHGESAAANDLRNAAREWQASCSDSMDSLTNHPWVAHAYKHWVDLASQTWEPISAAPRVMSYWPFSHGLAAHGKSSAATGATDSARPQA